VDVVSADAAFDDPQDCFQIFRLDYYHEAVVDDFDFFFHDCFAAVVEGEAQHSFHSRLLHAKSSLDQAEFHPNTFYPMWAFANL
jgi:hypothetical protein